jgi:O-methyltransferase
MIRPIEEFVGKTASRFGLSISRVSTLENRLPVEATSQDREVIGSVRPFTMTSSERIWSLLRAVEYVHDNKVAGDFVECGVWRGGSVMAMIAQLKNLNAPERRIWLYDTFEGMTAPTTHDVDSVAGITAAQLLDSTEVADGNNVWCVASIEDVEANLSRTGYAREHLVFVKGDVAVTLKETAPERIALLRLDTDWYESTKAELEILYPKLVPGGVCILDDYGHWKGARKAVDDYFEEIGARPLLMPIDFSGRIFTKPL